jgi:hypothetical protein
LHVLPTLWFRNQWSGHGSTERPTLEQAADQSERSVVKAVDASLGELYLYCEGEAPLLFTENETNTQRIFGMPSWKVTYFAWATTLAPILISFSRSVVGAVLELELIPAALLRRAGSDEPLLRCVVQIVRAERFVHEDAGVLLGNATCHGRLESVVDDLLGSGNFRRLGGAQIAVPGEHLRLKRAGMVEGQDVERPVEADGLHAVPLILR